MKAMDESFDDKLSKRLKRFSQEPAERLWSSITARIESEERAVRLKKKARIGWVLIFCSITIGGIFYLSDVGFQKSQPSVTGETKQQAKDGSPNKEIVSGENLQQSKPLEDVKLEKDQALHQLARRVESSQSLIASSEEASMNTKEKQVGTLNDPTYVEDSESAVDQFERNKENIVSEIVSNTTDSSALKSLQAKRAEKPAIDQEHKSTEAKRNRFSIYFTVMPTLGYQRIKPNSSDNLIVESIDRLSTFSTDRLGIRAELGVEYPVANRIHLFGGLVYFQRAQTIGYTEKVVSNTGISQGPNGEVIFEPEFSYQNKVFEYEVRNLGLQVGASYQLAKRKFLQTLGTGIEFHLALNKAKDVPEFTNNPSAYVFYNLYYRLQYPADTKLRAVVQPTLNYSFYINQNRDAPFYVKPYGLGLNVGVTYNFNR